MQESGCAETEPEVVKSADNVSEEENTTENERKTIQESEAEVSRKYTEDEIKEMKINDIKEILDKLGVSYDSIPYKRDAYVKALMDAQEK